jgi:hypothetical protein
MRRTIMSTVLTSALPAADRLRAERIISGQEFIIRQVAQALGDLADDLDFTSTIPWVNPEHRYTH